MQVVRLLSWPWGCHSMQYVVSWAQAGHRMVVPLAPALTFRAPSLGRGRRPTLEQLRPCTLVQDSRSPAPFSPQTLSPGGVCGGGGCWCLHLALSPHTEGCGAGGCGPRGRVRVTGAV